MSIKKQLDMARKNWKKAKEKAESGAFGDTFEDGRYKVTIAKAELQESKSSGRLQVMLAYEFLEGGYLGKTKYDYPGIDSEDNLARFLGLMGKMGFEIDNPDDIEDALEELVEKRITLRVSLKTRGEFQNVFIEKVLTGSEAEEEVGTEDAVPEEPTEAELKVGMEVTFEYKGKELSGEVKEILEDTEEAKVKAEGKIFRIKVDKLTLVEEVAAEEEPTPEEPAEEPAPEEETTTDLQEGMEVSFTLKGEEVTGVVKEVLENTEEARVEYKNKVYRIKVDKLTLVEEEPEPRKVVKKKGVKKVLRKKRK